MTNCPYCRRPRSQCGCNAPTAFLLLLLTACGPESFYSIPPADDSGDAGPNSEASDAQTDRDAPELDSSPDADAAIDTKDAACPYVGSVACDDAINAYCNHYASCCQQFPGNGNCSVGWAMANKCKADLSQGGYDCNSGKYNKLVCGSPTQCMNSTAAATCTAMFQSTGPNMFSGCGTFWGQF